MSLNITIKRIKKTSFGPRHAPTRIQYLESIQSWNLTKKRVDLVQGSEDCTSGDIGDAMTLRRHQLTDEVLQFRIPNFIHDIFCQGEQLV
ncbi:hypothetical protein D3C76_715560 [compost metagenome]